jgi:hypothetical protein
MRISSRHIPPEESRCSRGRIEGKYRKQGCTSRCPSIVAAMGIIVSSHLMCERDRAVLRRCWVRRGDCEKGTYIQRRN